MTAGPLENIILKALYAEVPELVYGRLVTKPVQSGEVLYEPDNPLLHMIFPHSGIISLQVVLQDGRTVENMSIGRDSFIGVDYLLGERVTSYHAVVAISGRASWLSANDFAAALTACEPLQGIMRGASRGLLRDLMRGVVCASVHSASQRVATWLLRALDRNDSNQFDITQRTLANIFGLRLATISDACARLHAAGAIDHGRGTMTITDRDMLESQCCECYRDYPRNGR